MLKYWLWLASRRNLSPREQLAVLRHFGTPEAAYCAEKSALSEVEGLRSTASLEDKSLMEPEEILNECYRKQISILTYQDAAYPDRLRSIDDPPMVLYYQGTVPAIDTEPVIAVVGTRKASAYGLVQAKQLGYQLGRMGAVVVSGGADGIDTMAMKGALTAGAPVIGVLGCGVDVVYPAANRSLFEDVRTRGWLVSEYPPGTAAIGAHFPVRNRLIAGLSMATVVIQCRVHSGTMLTAGHALSQGRDLFAVPDSIFSAMDGANSLLAQGAEPALSGEQILLRYPEIYGYPLEAPNPPASSPAPPATQKAASASRREEAVPAPGQSATQKAASASRREEAVPVPPAYLSGEQAKVYAALAAGSQPVDLLCERCELAAGALLAILTQLELFGLVRLLPGRMVEIVRRS